jgi:hypothetical protein
MMRHALTAFAKEWRSVPGFVLAMTFIIVLTCAL